MYLIKIFLKNQKGFSSLILIFAVVAVIVGVYLTRNFDLYEFAKARFAPRFASSGASEGIEFIGTDKQVITETPSAQVVVRITSPWQVQPTQNAYLDGLIPVISHVNAQDSSTRTRVAQVTASVDDVNEDGSSFFYKEKVLFAGNGSSLDKSTLGLRFRNLGIPKGVEIKSANIEVYSPKSSWIPVKNRIYGENTANSTPFSISSRPSQKSFTISSSVYDQNVNWKAGTWNSIGDVTNIVKELVSKGEWIEGNSMSFIFKGFGPRWSRKLFPSYDGNNGLSPKLTVIYSETVSPTSSPVPSATVAPSPVMSATPTLSPSPSPLVYVKAALLAEDQAFTKNLITLNNFVQNPTEVTYVFTDSSPGEKILHAKIISTTGEEKVYSTKITLKTPLPSVTPVPSQISQGGNSMAMGKWNPNPKHDICPNSADTSRIKEIHDSYKVVGPDGKFYPTWHPPVDPATGCKFGHEHGRDPSQSMVWKQVKEYFFFDTNKNGLMDPSEESVSGLPFGYVNEQLDVYNSASSVKTGMRHEDHVGHKVDWVNDETDLATHQMSTTKNTGAWVGKLGNGTMQNDTGIRCFYLSKPHQGVSTPDAFMNNIHEVFYFADCRHQSDPSYNQKVSVALIEGFGSAGGFTNFMPMCKIERRSAPQDLICPLGKNTDGSCTKDAVNQNYPDGGHGSDREIISRDCMEIGFLVPQGQWSGNMYEAWPASLNISTAGGKSLIKGINLLFDVEDANRYYYPETQKTKNGYNNPDAKTNLGFTMDLCYENFGGRIARGGPCEWATNYGRVTDIKWDDPRSAFRGVHRGMYFQPGILENNAGPEIWYTDPFGKNASTTPFAGSVKQQLTPKNLNYSSLIGGQSIDPRVTDRVHDNGNGTVHAPN